MSFWPFPTNLAAELRRAASCGPVLEFGAGAGDLAVRLRSLDLSVVTLDIDPRFDVDVLADLRRPPFGDGRAGAIVLGDVLRHLDSISRDEAAAATVSVIARDGSVVVLEDHPEGRDEAERNYRETLALLADVVSRRGPARRIDRLTLPWSARLGPPVVAGEAENLTEVVDPDEPLVWMRRTIGSERILRDRLDVLSASVARHGMRYGRYCFEVFRRNSA